MELLCNNSSQAIIVHQRALFSGGSCFTQLYLSAFSPGEARNTGDTAELRNIEGWAEEYSSNTSRPPRASVRSCPPPANCFRSPAQPLPPIIHFVQVESSQLESPFPE
ncbi:hypothetical protein J1605_011972 [Eschrichtius robustus]|uniref:Uncharacterized protein n=1 Tax=Eschrichtius robustus TaxID=9764 RepID=A0AB34GM27_ESCRO|nr:hypothetical protein J1605_011972 [Eschrichtius robustus]